MNKELAEIYGTAGEETLEKQAAAELAEALSDDNGIDLNSLTVEDVEALAAEMIGGEEAETAEEGEQAEGEKTAEAEQAEETDEGKQKLAEADYLGRVMAHAFYQEKTELEKVALNRVGAAAAYTAGQAGEKAKKGLEALKNSKVGKHVAAHSKAYGRGAKGAALAGAFGAGRASKKGKEKKGGAEEQETSTPALDALTANRVNEILAANGINPETLEKAEEKSEKTAADAKADPTELVASVVEDRALATLEAAGFDVSELRGEKAEEKK